MNALVTEALKVEQIVLKVQLSLAVQMSIYWKINNLSQVKEIPKSSPIQNAVAGSVKKARIDRR